MVLRTPSETLKKMSESTDKDTKKLGSLIERVENLLDRLRNLYLTNHIQTVDMRLFINDVKSLEAKGVYANYYVQEMLLYTPKNGL